MKSSNNEVDIICLFQRGKLNKSVKFRAANRIGEMADSAAAPVVQSEINGSSGNSEEDISKDTLLSLLKDKSKEIKLLSTKLTKLEEKYVKTLKESKPIKKDHDSLLRFLFNDVFSAEPYMLSPQPSVGEFEYNTL